MGLVFESKVALVTGGGSGIGRASALALAREKAKVVVADVAVENGQETAHMAKEAGAEVIFIECDVTKAADVQAMVSKTVQTFGHLDCAVNNAGIEGVLAPIIDYPEEIWNQVISINLTGVWLCMKYEVPAMLKQGGGAIVNISSAAGLVGVGNATAYTAAKHGVVGLSKSVALEYAREGIRVNAVCPGATRTPMLERLVDKHPKMEEWYLSVPAGRIAAVEELAQAVVWLCSDSSSFVTGHAMAVDGGLTAC